MSLRDWGLDSDSRSVGSGSTLEKDRLRAVVETAVAEEGDVASGGALNENGDSPSAIAP